MFEVWSPSNRAEEMARKFAFYERYGAEEYYLVYPDFPAQVHGWRRDGGKLVEIPEMNGFVSPRLNWRFQVVRGELTVFGPDGRPLVNPVDVALERDAERARAAKMAAKLRELGLDPDSL